MLSKQLLHAGLGKDMSLKLTIFLRDLHTISITFCGIKCIRLKRHYVVSSYATFRSD